MSLPSYRKIDQSTWPRQDHYKYYTEKLKVNYSMTARLDVTRLRAECDRLGVHFYAAFIWCTSNVVNRLPFMKMMTDEKGNPGVWDVIHPNYTIFHKEDHTFSDCWSEYDADFATFYKRIETDIEAAKKVRGVKAKAGQPVNFYCISCVPWLDYTGYATSTVSDHVALFPIITFGKYTEDNGELTLPLTLTIAHAAMDGWHTSEFFREMQRRHPQQVAFTCGFMPTLSRQIYAGADFFLMPSQSEPCGLAQMIALRYGTIPIVRSTGGLADSIIDWDTPGGGCGSTFQSYNADDMLGAVRRAMGLYHSEYRAEMLPRALKCDFSWRRSAKQYMSMYLGI